MDILKNTDAMGKRIFADLEKINFIRTSTSAEETRAAHIIKDELAKEGMEAVIEEFMVETADIHKVSLKALGKEWEIKGYRRSGSTPPEGLTAEFAYVQQGNDIDLYDKKGKIVLVNSGRLTEEVYEKLVRYGVAGFLTWNGNVSDVREDTDLGETELRYWALRYGTVPGGVLRAIDAMELVKGEPETVTFTLIQDDVTRPSRNVVLHIKGTEDTNENITFGAHFDSVEFSHGVYDNGAGSAILMELARHYKQNPPKRNLTFCWYGSEEVGLLGSKAYVAAHNDQRRRSRSGSGCRLGSHHGRRVPLPLCRVSGKRGRLLHRCYTGGLLQRLGSVCKRGCSGNQLLPLWQKRRRNDSLPSRCNRLPRL